MPAALPLKQPVKVSQLVRRRLRELKRTPRELAEAVKVSEQYMSDLVAGRRRPPAPGRTDLYVPMAKFLRLHRNDLPTCARVERAAEPAQRRPDPLVWKLVLGLCEPTRQRAIARRVTKPDGAELQALIVGRLLEVSQGFVRRRLEDEVGLRVAATRDGCTYLDARMRLLEFLDVCADSLSAGDCEEFVAPRIAAWDIELETCAMRIVLRSS
ncbi:MAG TPA: helix-turn-helix transcriptional regulator [Gemmatimonadales bacterium]|nr:helix-turn-helix transcriptional regulator [Gemmatimonadales bacterium]